MDRRADRPSPEPCHLPARRVGLSSRAVAAALALCLPLSGCDLGEAQPGASVRTRPYTGLLDTELGRRWALARANGGRLPASSAETEDLVAEQAFRASRFALDEAQLARPDGDRAAQIESTRLREQASPRARLPRPAQRPALTPGLLAALTGQPIESFAAYAPELEPEAGPHLFVPEAWGGRAAGLLAAGGARDDSPLPEPGLAAEPDAPPPYVDLLPDLDLLDESTSLLRYACCDDVPVYEDAARDSDVIATLAKAEVVWVLDLLPSTGLQSAMDDLEACGAAGTCRSVVTELAQRSNVDYFAVVFLPEAGVSGFVDLPALTVRPVDATPGEVVLETGFGRIAKSLRTALDERFHGGSCGDPANTYTVHAYSKDLYYDPSTLEDHTCDSALACDDWRVASCDDLDADDEGFEACVYESVGECGGPTPDRDPSSERVACVKNVCPGKSTCGVCREWFAATGQDETGWQTEIELVDSCVQALWANKPDPDDADPPIECIGDPDCTTYCQQFVQTWNVSACGRYVAAWDSRSFADAMDYECGELPVGETHPTLWYYNAVGEWSGEPDYDWKEIGSFDLFDRPHRFDLGRLDSQDAISFSTPDLTLHGGAHGQALGNEIGARNLWLAIDPAPVDEDVVEGIEGERAGVFLNACVHVPGVSFRGPDVEYDPDDTPFFLIESIDFGSGSIDRADLCAFGAAALDDELAPQLTWLDASLSLDDIEYGGAEVNKGPGFWLLAAASRLVPVVGEILQHVILGAVLVEEIVEGVISGTDLDSWFVDFLLRAYESKVTDRILEVLNEETRQALRDLDLDAQGRLATLCDELDPGVGPAHPYYWFYRHLRGECERVQETGALDPVVSNDASRDQGCYGEDALFTPDDAESGAWWQQYAGQEWYFFFVPDSGCRVGTRVEATLDSASWPVLRCGAATLNAYWNNGFVGEVPDTTSGIGLLTGEVPGPTPEEQFEALGELGWMVKEACSAAGHLALEDLYGDGRDLAELWRAKHGDGGLGKVSGD